MPTSRRRLVTHRNARPPTAHCSSTVAASRVMRSGGPARRRRYRRPVARPLLAALVVSALVAGCSGGDRPSTTSERTTTTTAGAEDLPPEVDAFLRRAASSEQATFTATYDVLRKLGGVRSTAAVAAASGGARITVGDLVVLVGDHPATCRVSARSCVGEVREDQLGQYGIFSRFWSTGPADALRTVVRRDDDGRPVPSTRVAAGVSLECIAVP